MELLLLQTGELAQTHLYDSTCLHIGERESLHQSGNSVGRCVGSLDDTDYLIYIV